MAEVATPLKDSIKGDPLVEQQIEDKKIEALYELIGRVVPNKVKRGARCISMRCKDLEKSLLDGKGWVTRDIPIYDGDEQRPHEDIDADKLAFKNEMSRKNRDFRNKATGRPVQANSDGKLVEVAVEKKKVVTKPTTTAKEEDVEEHRRDDVGRRIVPNIQYEEMDLRLDANTGNTTVLFGSSKKGKTTLMMDIYEKNYMDKKYISVGMFKNSQDGRYNVPGLHVAGRYSANLVDLMYEVNKKSGNKFRFLVMIDDFIEIKDSTVNNLVLTLRNADISTVISLQYVRLLSKASRGSVNNVIIFGMNSEEARKDAIDIYLKSWLTKKLKESGIASPSDQDRDELFVTITSNHGFFYLRPDDGVVHVCRLKK